MRLDEVSQGDCIEKAKQPKNQALSSPTFRGGTDEKEPANRDRERWSGKVGGSQQTIVPTEETGKLITFFSGSRD